MAPARFGLFWTIGGTTERVSISQGPRKPALREWPTLEAAQAAAARADAFANPGERRIWAAALD